MTYWKIALLAGITGAILAGCIAFAISDQYKCYASMAVEKPGFSQGRMSQWRLAQALQEANLEILGRDGLIELIERLDLYQTERRRSPVEQIAENTFRKHMRVVPYDSHMAGVQAFMIVFEYPDRYKAKQVVDRLTEEYKSVFAQTLGGPVLSVLEVPQTPERPFYPNRLMIVTTGLIAGMMMGVLSLKMWRRSRSYAVVTMSIPKDIKHFVDSQVAAGHFGSVSDYVRELIRADEQRYK